MTAIILWCIMMSSVSFFSAAAFDRRFEETMPLGLFLSAGWMFLFGLFGQLRAGLFSLMAVSAVILLMSICYAVRKHTVRHFLGNLLTPAFLCYLAGCAVMYVMTVNRNSFQWDEFSHWQDTIRAMYYTGHLNSAAVNRSMFPGYPPAMAMLQYPLAVLESLFNGGVFPEWTGYFVYNMVSLSLFLPCLKRLEYRRIWMLPLAAGMAFTVPLLFSHGAYTTLYIDAFLGEMAGFCMIHVLTMRQDDRLDKATLMASLAFLTLTKESGLLFAILTGLFAVYREKKAIRKPRTFREWLVILRWPLIPAAAQLIWRTSMLLGGTQRHSGGPAALLNSSMTGESLAALVRGYHELLSGPIYIAFDDMGREVLPRSMFPSYYILLLLMGIAITLMACWSRKDNAGKWIDTVVCSWGLFIIGLLGVYAKGMDANQAAFYACADRYLGTVLSMGAYMMFALLPHLKPAKKAISGLALFMVMFVLFFPIDTMRLLARGQARLDSWGVSAAWHTISDTALQEIRQDGRDPSETEILVLNTDINGMDTLVMRSLLRPCKVITMEPGSGLELTDVLADYDYLLPYATDDAFKMNTSPFLAGESVMDTKLYRIEKQDGSQRLCPVTP